MSNAGARVSSGACSRSAGEERVTPTTWAVFLACMLANAVVFSALGPGGGVLYTPIQVLFGIGFHTAAKKRTDSSSSLTFRLTCSLFIF